MLRHDESRTTMISELVAHRNGGSLTQCACNLSRMSSAKAGLI